MMEDTHTTQLLHKPIKERCFISFYCPGGEARWTPYKCSTLLDGSMKCIAKYKQAKEEPEIGKQKGLHSDNTGYIQKQTSTANTVKELRAGSLCPIEKLSLFPDVLSRRPAFNPTLNMGNQDGKFEDVQETECKQNEREQDCGALDLQYSWSSERKKSDGKIKKLKKIGRRKENTEESACKAVKNKKIVESEPFVVCAKEISVLRDEMCTNSSVSNSPNSVNYSKSKNLQPAMDDIDMLSGMKRATSEVLRGNSNFQENTRTTGLNTGYDFKSECNDEFITEDLVTSSNSLLDDLQDTIKLLQDQHDNVLQSKQMAEKLPEICATMPSRSLPSDDQHHCKVRATPEEAIATVVTKIHDTGMVVQNVVPAILRSEESISHEHFADEPVQSCVEEQNISTVVTEMQSERPAVCHVVTVPVIDLEYKTAVVCGQESDSDRNLFKCDGGEMPMVVDSETFTGCVNKHLISVIENDQFYEAGEWHRVEKGRLHGSGTNWTCDNKLFRDGALDIKEKLFSNPLQSVDGISLDDTLKEDNKTVSLPLLIAVSNVCNSPCPTNNAQHVSPVASPLTSGLPSPQHHHRILPLPVLETEHKTSQEDCSKPYTSIHNCTASKETEVGQNLEGGVILHQNLSNTNEKFQQQDYMEQDVFEKTFLKQQYTDLAENGSLVERDCTNTRPQYLDLQLFTMDGENIDTNTQTFCYMEGYVIMTPLKWNADSFGDTLRGQSVAGSTQSTLADRINGCHLLGKKTFFSLKNNLLKQLVTFIRGCGFAEVCSFSFMVM